VTRRSRAAPSDLSEVASAAEATIRSAAPFLGRVIEWEAPTFQGREDVCTIGGWKDFVAVGLWSGAKLASRHPLLEGSAPTAAW
jgi:hypothetical protein